MKALSLTQPWATLVAIGAKRIETRSLSTKYRGVVAIHAAKGFPGLAQQTCWQQPFHHSLIKAGFNTADDLPRGAIVAVADLVGVFPTDETWRFRELPRTSRVEQYDITITENEIAFGNYAPGRYGWLLKNVIRLDTPVPCKGALGLWTVPPDIECQVRETAVA